MLTIDYMAADGNVNSLRVPFGLRELSVKEDLFHCNARPLCLRGVWHAPLSTPEGLAPQLMQDVRHARLNSVRLLWPDSAILRAADEAGLLVFVQLPPLLDDASATALMERYHAHPSIAGWWQVGERGDAAINTLWQHDPTRLVLQHRHDSGTTRFYRPRKQQAENVTSFSFFAAPPFQVELESYWRRIEQEGSLTIVEALSAFGVDHAPTRVPPGLEGIADSPDDLFTAGQSLQGEAVRYPVDAFRLNARIAGGFRASLLSRMARKRARR